MLDVEGWKKQLDARKHTHLHFVEVETVLCAAKARPSVRLGVPVQSLSRGARARADVREVEGSRERRKYPDIDVHLG